MFEHEINRSSFGEKIRRPEDNGKEQNGNVGHALKRKLWKQHDLFVAWERDATC